MYVVCFAGECSQCESSEKIEGPRDKVPVRGVSVEQKFLERASLASDVPALNGGTFLVRHRLERLSQDSWTTFDQRKREQY